MLRSKINQEIKEQIDNISRYKTGAGSTHDNQSNTLIERYINSTVNVPECEEKKKEIEETKEIEKSLISRSLTGTYVIPEGITSIGAFAFAYMTKISTLKMPSSLVNIGTCALRSCALLDAIVSNAVVPPVLSANALFDCPKITSIYVPDESVDAYKTATNWVTYAAKIKPLSSYTE